MHDVFQIALSVILPHSTLISTSTSTSIAEAHIPASSSEHLIDSEATLFEWIDRLLLSDFITCYHFEQLAGSVRLNSNMTETALPFPLSLTSQQLTLLQQYFFPLPLPVATYKGMFPIHALMNHSCQPNARVENGDEYTLRAIKHGQCLDTSTSTSTSRSHPRDSLARRQAKLQQCHDHLRHTASLNYLAPPGQPHPLATTTIHVFSTRDIAPNEAISISYLPTELLPTEQDTAAEKITKMKQRQLMLKEKYLFVCSCPACEEAKLLEQDLKKNTTTKTSSSSSSSSSNATASNNSSTNQKKKNKK